ncbi:MAG: Asp23/Gls24 family envelope stress response protein [Peptococcaceae bacterium]|nr:Asp23/Gls24 family envelope stress response protein [Peptococcaceae bacterium]MBO5115569.1 Asp23/Gls24 family envelope stress response protein [Peptococcaceae bacterium]MBO5429029.1 Asp23/Gls24 family envelope stress response protein [Peptococcaceae bacterium]MBP3341797.1 Asp23/Gls24 family envelope stress response protein [Peptococcaceae bacterium]MBP3584604.1 Asp23/Gls24 family envelope stress response protein [Peptococcaceae bacterium]
MQGETETAYGMIHISEEAVATIVRMAADRVEGIAHAPLSMASGFTEKLGKKNPAKGVKVELTEHEVKISLYIYVTYGVKIPKLAMELQKEIRQMVQLMTGLSVKEVNIYVQGISFEKENEREGQEYTRESAETEPVEDKETEV